MKRIVSILLMCLLGIGITISSTLPIQAEVLELGSTQSDIDLIKERLTDYFLSLDTIDDGAKVEAIYVNEAKDHFENMEDNGSWADVDYAARDNAANGKAWSPYLALDRMQALAIAYQLPTNELYKDQSVIKGLNKALIHWKEKAPSSTNWWENDIGVNLRFGRIGLFLENELSSDAFQVIINSLNKEGILQGTGQNNLWYDQNAIYRALITNDSEQLKKVIDECLAYILVLQTDNTTLEALQVDNSLYFHGIQFYSNGYGLSMFRDMSFWLFMLRETQFALGDEVVNRMSDYMLDGTRWTIRGDINELYLGYRPYKVDVNYKNYAEEYIDPLRRMMEVDGLRSAEYKTLLDNISGIRNDNGLSGNNYMWRVGYASQMNDKYGVNIKMDSKRIVGGEWRGSWPANGDNGNLIYWTSSASSTFVVDGDEYNTVFPTFDWAHSPGVTSPNFIPKNYSNYGRFSNNTDHTIGLSAGENGSTSYAMDKYSTTANKSYFFFGDEVVALGSNISSTNENEIHTTINQTKSDNLIVDGVPIESGAKFDVENVSTIHNNKIGYLFPEEQNISISNGQQQEKPSLWNDSLKEVMPDTFSSWINHKVKPKGDSYSYIVLPGVSVSEMEYYISNNPIEIIENSTYIHAASHKEKKLTQINFFNPGKLEYSPGKFVEVDKAVNLMIDESGAITKISLAMTDTDYNKNVSVKLTKDGNITDTSFNVYPTPFTGKTLTLNEGASNKVESSGSEEGYSEIYAFDNDVVTYWKAQATPNQWISKALGDRKFVSSVSIDWNEIYAEKYRVQGSLDGHNYFDLATIAEGEGGLEKVQINQITNYIRVMVDNLGGHEGIEINEIKIVLGENISKGKTVNVSSTSTNDPGNIASFIVDGNTSTRWSSKRDSSNEWVIIDFGGEATLNALTINWEAARSDSYSIEISNDRSNWTPIASKDETTSLIDSFIFEEEIVGRYLRLNSIKSVSPKYGISIFEIEAYGQVDEVVIERENIALNKPSESSSVYVNPFTGFALESKYAFDGSIENGGNSFQSRWVSYRETEDEWILVDLEDDYSINSVVLNWEGAHASEYKLMASSDKEIWTEVHHDDNGKSGITEINFDDVVDARYLKMQGIKPATKYGYSLWEFEVYGSVKELENVALNKETKASSVYMNPRNGFSYESKYAVDGSIVNNGETFQSRWVSDRESDDEWIYVNLDGFHTINSVVTNWEGAHAKEFIIQVSNDGRTWIDVQKITEGVSGITEYIFEELGQGQYVRIKGVKPATKYGYSLWEFEVYGKKVADSFVDKSQLMALVTSISDTQSIEYTLESFDVFSSELMKAISSLESDEGSQEDINLQIEVLALAYEELELRDTVALESLLETAITYIEENYTPESYNPLKEAINDARLLIKSGANTNQEYYDMSSRLQDAINGLEEKEVELEKKAQELADTISTLDISMNKVVLPEFEGFDIKINSSSNTEIISTNGDVNPQAEDTHVTLVLLITSKTNPEDIALTKEILLKVDQTFEGVDHKAQAIADTILVLIINKNKVILPVYEGFDFKIQSSSDPGIISTNGDVNPPDKETNVTIVLSVTNRENSKDFALTKEIVLTVEKNVKELNYEGLLLLVRTLETNQKNIFTKHSFELLVNAIEEAKALVLTGADNNNQIIEMLGKLKTAQSNLVNTQSAKRALEVASKIDQSVYTKITVQNLNQAIESLDLLLKSSSPTSTQLKESEQNLYLMISNLRYISDDTNDNKNSQVEKEVIDVEKEYKENVLIKPEIGNESGKVNGSSHSESSDLNSDDSSDEIITGQEETENENLEKKDKVSEQEIEETHEMNTDEVKSVSVGRVVAIISVISVLGIIIVKKQLSSKRDK